MDPNLFNWYLIFNRHEFEEFKIPSKMYSVILNGIGEKDILATRGNLLSIVYNSTMVSLDTGEDPQRPFLGPFFMDNIGIYQNENSDIFLGVLK